MIFYMNNEDPELQQRNETLLLLLAEKSVNESKKNPSIQFKDTHKVALNYWKIVFPWPLRLTLFIYAFLLKIQLRHRNFLISYVYADRTAFFENIESLKFASQFGCRANLKGRNWCNQLFKTSQIDSLDQPFLVWTKTINVRKCEVHYGKWDIITGIVSAVPLLMIIFLMLCTALCLCLPAATKVTELSVYIFIFLLKYQFLKSHSIDTFKVGSKYFHAVGWSFVPASKFKVVD